MIASQRVDLRTFITLRIPLLCKFFPVKSISTKGSFLRLGRRVSIENLCRLDPFLLWPLDNECISERAHNVPIVSSSVALTFKHIFVFEARSLILGHLRLSSLLFLMILLGTLDFMSPSLTAIPLKFAHFSETPAVHTWLKLQWLV